MHLKKTFSRFGVILTLLLSIYSCNTTQDSSTDLITIDVEKAYNEPQRGIKLSEVVEDIEYVKLETNPECLIGRVFGVAISDNFIAVYGFTTKSIFK